MRISENNKSRLYNAISYPIMQQRVNLKMTSTENVKADQVDDMLFKLEKEIAQEVYRVLNIKESE